MNTILVGYEIGTGKEVWIEVTHLVCTGITNKSGKTTLLEGLACRGPETQKFLAFRSKPDEQVFKEGHFIKPFLSDQSDWQYMKQLLESSQKMKMRFETWHIMKAAKNTSTLGGFYQNCLDLAESTKRGMDKQIFEVLAEYTKTIIEELKDVVFTRDFPELKAGVNIMDLSEIQDEDVQSIIIRSTLAYVLHRLKSVITVIPELWKFSPQGRNNPVKEILQALVRQGANKRDFVWVDSQDLAGTDKIPLKQCYTWILGLQTEVNEAEHTLSQVNLPPKTKPKAHEITSLSLGQFYLSTPKGSVKFYALPRWLPEKEAIKVAMGKMDPETAFAKFGPKDQTEEASNPMLIQEIREQKLRADEAEREATELKKKLEAMQDPNSLISKQLRREPESAPVQRPSPAKQPEVGAENEKQFESLGAFKQALGRSGLTEKPPGPSIGPSSSVEILEPPRSTEEAPSSAQPGLKPETKTVGTITVELTRLVGPIDVKILYVMKLKGADLFPSEVAAAWPEYAWTEDPHTIANHMGSLFKSGVISKRTSGRYFLAPKVGYQVKDSVEAATIRRKTLDEDVRLGKPPGTTFTERALAKDAETDS